MDAVFVIPDNTVINDDGALNLERSFSLSPSKPEEARMTTCDPAAASCSFLPSHNRESPVLEASTRARALKKQRWVMMLSQSLFTGELHRGTIVTIERRNPLSCHHNQCTANEDVIGFTHTAQGFGGDCHLEQPFTQPKGYTSATIEH